MYDKGVLVNCRVPGHHQRMKLLTYGSTEKLPNDEVGHGNQSRTEIY